MDFSDIPELDDDYWRNANAGTLDVHRHGVVAELRFHTGGGRPGPVRRVCAHVDLAALMRLHWNLLARARRARS